jgi:hypothetical protein
MLQMKRQENLAHFEALYDEVIKIMSCRGKEEAGHYRLQSAKVSKTAYVMGSIGEDGTPRDSIALPARKHKSSR